MELIHIENNLFLKFSNFLTHSRPLLKMMKILKRGLYILVTHQFGATCSCVRGLVSSQISLLVFMSRCNLKFPYTKLVATARYLQGRLMDKHNSLIRCQNSTKLQTLESSFQEFSNGLQFNLQIQFKNYIIKNLSIGTLWFKQLGQTESTKLEKDLQLIS